MTEKKRLDVLLVERGLSASREQAQAVILAGEVWSGQLRLDKPGTKYAADLPIEVRSRTPSFVSRAGAKLQHALENFQISPGDKVCLDVGASTGGFTHCLLKQGADHVFAVDVGYGQIDVALRQDSRVSVLEKTNARYLKRSDLLALNPKAVRLDLLVIDVSFISLRLVLAPLKETFPEIREWILLFKPQFEVGRDQVGKGGVVKSDAALIAALQSFEVWMADQGFHQKSAPSISPLAGKKSGNLEYLLYYELPPRV